MKINAIHSKQKNISNECVRFTSYLETVQLQPPLLAKNNILRCHNKQITIQLVQNFLLQSIVHVKVVVMHCFVDENTVRELNCEPGSVDSDFLDVVPGLDSHFLLGDKMLDNDVRHRIAVSIPIPVQPMHSGEDGLIHRGGSVIGSTGKELDLGAGSQHPDPI